MFIEKLWEENSELVIKVVKRIFGINEERGDTFKFEKSENGVLNFSVFGRECCNIYVSDFDIGTIYSIPFKVDSAISIRWLKFMYKTFGDKYIYHFIAHRNNELDKFIAAYEEEYNDQTKKILNGIGFNVNNDKTK